MVVSDVRELTTEQERVCVCGVSAAPTHTPETHTPVWEYEIVDWPAGGRINPLPAQTRNPALRGLIRSRFDPVVAGSTRWRFDPALERVDPLAA